MTIKIYGYLKISMNLETTLNGF